MQTRAFPSAKWVSSPAPISTLAMSEHDHSPPPSADDDARSPAPAGEQWQPELWPEWARTPLERMPLPFGFGLASITILIVAEQLWEKAQTRIETTNTTFSLLPAWLLLPVLTVYMMVVWRLLRRRTLQALRSLRPSVQISNADYHLIAQRMLRTGRHTYLGLATATLAIVLVVFVLLDIPMPAYDDVFLPRDNAFLAAAIIASYTFFGWIGLSLSYDALSHAIGLRRLSSRSLALNVLDATNVLEFGRLSLWHSATLAGVILIPILTLGPPTHVGFLVLALTLVASVLTLILPLWGVHVQMVQVKDGAGQKINSQLGEVHAALMDESYLSSEALDNLAARTEKLALLRTHILKAPNWPFRDLGALIRALAAATSPLIYIVLTEIIQRYVVPLVVK